MSWGSESHAMETGTAGTGAINYTLRQPLGVVGCISPWNLPLYLFTWKIAPALAAGNTVVAKPSEVTPCTAALLGELSIEAGFPPGVLNIVLGRGPSVGQAIVEHPAVRAISFTGSTATGAQIARSPRHSSRKCRWKWAARIRRSCSPMPTFPSEPGHHRALGFRQSGRDLPVRFAPAGAAIDLRSFPRTLPRQGTCAASRRSG
jgi:NAD-dependent aldehyde dehydrogenases